MAMFDFLSGNANLGGGPEFANPGTGATTPAAGSSINWLALAPMVDMLGQQVATQTGGNNPLGGIASKYAPQLAQAQALAKQQAETKAWRENLLKALTGKTGVEGKFDGDGNLTMKVPSGLGTLEGGGGVDSLLGNAGNDTLVGGVQGASPFPVSGNSSLNNNPALMQLLAGPDLSVSGFDLAALSPEQQLAVVQSGLAGNQQASQIVGGMYEAMLKDAQIKKAQAESQIVDVDLGGTMHKVRLADVPDMYKNYIDQQYKNGQLRIDDEKNRIEADKAKAQIAANKAAASKDFIAQQKAQFELEAATKKEQALQQLEQSGIGPEGLMGVNAGTLLRAGVNLKDVMDKEGQTLAQKELSDKKKQGVNLVYKEYGADTFFGIKPESRPSARMASSVVEGMLDTNPDLNPATTAAQANSAVTQYFSSAKGLTGEAEKDLSAAQQMLKYVRPYGKYLDMNDLLQPFRDAGYSDKQATILIQRAAQQ